MDESKIDSHLKTSALEQFKDFIYENYAKYIGIGKNKTDSASNAVGLSHFIEFLYNCISTAKIFFLIV